LLSSEINIDPCRPKERMWGNNSGLHKQILVFFTLLIVLASILSIATIYHHSRGEAGLDNVVALNQKTSPPATLGDEADPRINMGFENGLIIITVVMVCTLVLFMFFFISKISRPLNELEKMTRDMADGRLDQLVQDTKNAGCSIGMIGENVNSLAMNLQEVLLLVWNLSEHNLTTLDQTIENLENDAALPREQIGSRLQEIKTELEQMREITRQFEFFDVTLHDKKALAKDSTANSQPF